MRIYCQGGGGSAACGAWRGGWFIPIDGDSQLMLLLASALHQASGVQIITRKWAGAWGLCAASSWGRGRGLNRSSRNSGGWRRRRENAACVKFASGFRRTDHHTQVGLGPGVCVCVGGGESSQPQQQKQQCVAQEGRRRCLHQLCAKHPGVQIITRRWAWVLVSMCCVCVGGGGKAAELAVGCAGGGRCCVRQLCTKRLVCRSSHACMIGVGGGSWGLVLGFVCASSHRGLGACSTPHAGLHPWAAASRCDGSCGVYCMLVCLCS